MRRHLPLPRHLSLRRTVPVSLPREGIHMDDLLSDMERRYMALAVEQCKGNESQAAKLLNMNHHTFRYRWKKLKK